MRDYQVHVTIRIVEPDGRWVDGVGVRHGFSDITPIELSGFIARAYAQAIEYIADHYKRSRTNE